MHTFIKKFIGSLHGLLSRPSVFEYRSKRQQETFLWYCFLKYLTPRELEAGCLWRNEYIRTGQFFFILFSFFQFYTFYLPDQFCDAACDPTISVKISLRPNRMVRQEIGRRCVGHPSHFVHFTQMPPARCSLFMHSEVLPATFRVPLNPIPNFCHTH